jgi:ATP-dependent Clp protease protease subunit
MNLRKLPKQSRDWYAVKNKAAGEPAEVFIYDQIGASFWDEGVTPSSLIDEIKSLKLKNTDTLSVRINSPGGNMFDGNTIYNYLRSIKQNIDVTIDGMAASAASIIAMAGDTIRMPENSFLMIHNPWMVVAGDSQVMRKTADDLDIMRDGAIKTYMERAGDNLTRDELVTMMDEETWLGADRAVELGFADEVLEPVRAAALAKFDLENYFDKVPDAVSRIQNDERNKRAQRRADIKRLRAV